MDCPISIAATLGFSQDLTALLVSPLLMQTMICMGQVMRSNKHTASTQVAFANYDQCHKAKPSQLPSASEILLWVFPMLTAISPVTLGPWSWHRHSHDSSPAKWLWDFPRFLRSNKPCSLQSQLCSTTTSLPSTSKRNENSLDWQVQNSWGCLGSLAEEREAH